MRTYARLGILVFLTAGLVSFSSSARDLEAGMTGPDVKQWQLFLIRKGYMKPPALGNFSNRTLQATIKFQKRNGLQGLGMVGPKTIAKARQQGFRPFAGSSSSNNAGRISDSTLRKNAMLYLQDVLNDPYSAEVVYWGSTWYSDGKYLLSARIRAKNAFGAYVLSDWIFGFNKYGYVVRAERD